MPTLTFDKEQHAYAVDGEELPSVTQIIRAADLYPWPSDTQDATYYMKRGTAVHAACLYDDQGRLGPEGELDEEVLPRLEAWRRFRKDTGLEILMNERSLWHPTLKYAGTLDRLVELNGKIWLLDLKAGGHVPAYGIQSAGYAMLLQAAIAAKLLAPELRRIHARFPVKRAGVHLDGSGNYKIEEHNEVEDYSVFKWALGLHNWKRRNIA